MTHKSFSLIDMPWIKTNHGLKSLRDVISDPALVLAGTPVEKIVIYKILIAIFQAAHTPEDENEREAIGLDGFIEKGLHYLKEHDDDFDLYHSIKPFLQMPAIKAAQKAPFGALLPHVATGNTTVLTQHHQDKPLDDAQKAMLIVIQACGFGLGGKKTDNSIVLSPGYTGKIKPTAKPGLSVAHLGFLHTFYLGSSIAETVYINLWTHQSLNAIKTYTYGVGRPVWEHMPIGEDCPRARELKESLMGHLMPLDRFCLLADDGVHYSSGIVYDDYKLGVIEPSISVDQTTSNKPRALWCDPSKRPWRQVASFLVKNNSKLTCRNIINAQNRSTRDGFKRIWCGGLRVSSNAGEQYISGSDDFVESLLIFHEHAIGEKFFTRFESRVHDIENFSKMLYSATKGYFKELGENDSKIPLSVTNVFWGKSDHMIQDLIKACDDGSDDSMNSIKYSYFRIAENVYNQFCGIETARQIAAWAKHKPNFYKNKV